MHFNTEKGEKPVEKPLEKLLKEISPDASSIDSLTFPPALKNMAPDLGILYLLALAFLLTR